MKNNHLFIVVAFLVLWTGLTIIAVTWETSYDWPDNIHRDYGVPFVWSTQTLSTLVGPVDLWSVNVFALVMDLAFWLFLMLAASIIMLVVFNKKS